MIFFDQTRWNTFFVREKNFSFLFLLIFLCMSMYVNKRSDAAEQMRFFVFIYSLFWRTISMHWSAKKLNNFVLFSTITKRTRHENCYVWRQYYVYNVYVLTIPGKGKFNFKYKYNFCRIRTFLEETGNVSYFHSKQWQICRYLCLVKSLVFILFLLWINKHFLCGNFRNFKKR